MAPIKATSRKATSSNAKGPKSTPNPTFKRATPKRNPQLKQIFRGTEMSLSGNFTSCDKNLPHEQIAKWITLHGGSFEREVTESTTHLICSIEDYKKPTSQVKKASKLDKCQIVVFDWLEDCLLRKVKRLRAERGYTLERTIKRIAKGKKDQQRFREKFEEDKPKINPITNVEEGLNHVYYDTVGFEYKIVLTRVNHGSRMTTERYTMILFESHTKPSHYMFGAKYNRSSCKTSYYRDECRPKIFYDAFRDFKTFFTKKTGVEWDMRLEKIKNPGLFIYTPPALGLPVGEFPSGYVRPEERNVKMVTDTNTNVDSDGTTTHEGSETSSSGEESTPYIEMGLARRSLSLVTSHNEAY
ncbi:uncharacterized protein BP5553_01209 [Venustampulla echinocandica]|uniref:Uncharacterized protein n=1 Tax=Venustampulla echinocandica TaxID=2656787 RepID=A0A370U0C5_9HELO|nr:uncharacterized protein BP5553_01209 [Venustampulla echinocandica]RDL41230.1 hypothetical protein BP5553_01209 [Venustampulla echinocandica]